MTNITSLYPSGFSVHNAILITLLIVWLIYITYSIILYYHWKSYSGNLEVTSMTLITYFSLTIPLLIIMTVLAFII
jgi:membrane-associated HD superfamily phosphohydrolase